MEFFKERTAATGITSSGEIKIFKEPTWYYSVYVNDEDLISVDVTSGVQCVFCYDNPKLKNITLPSSVRYLQCDPEVLDYDTCSIHEVDVLYEDRQFPLLHF